MKSILSPKRLAALSVLTALSLISFLIENLIPSPFFLGARLGIANVFVTLVVVWYSLPEALIVLVAKLLLSAAFVGVGQLLYAAPAGLVSLVVTFVLVKTLSKSLSIVAVNALSAVAHNLTQLLVFALVTNSNAWYLAPYLTIVGLTAGVLTGSAVYFTVKILPSKLLGREKE
ncbi:MAG: Gx transporter family protein [Clostridia bacterium]|nr:Gx transporter family protein [Clostridia bacterium]